MLGFAQHSTEMVDLTVRVVDLNATLKREPHPVPVVERQKVEVSVAFQ